MKVIETKRTLIRQLKETDLGFYLELETDPEVMKFITNGKALESAEVERKLKKRVKEASQHRPLGFMIADHKETGAPVGAFMLLLERHDFSEFGYVLAKSFWGQGYALEVNRAIIDYAFNELEVDKIIATTDPRNLSSIRILEKLGFSFEGKKLHFIKALQKEVDSNCYSIERS